MFPIITPDKPCKSLTLHWFDDINDLDCRCRICGRSVRETRLIQGMI